VTILRSATATDVGQVRQVNQDRVLSTDDLWVVADGMGGHQAGEVAAEVAVASIRSHLDAHGAASLPEAVVDANTAVIERAGSSPDMAGMGTTVTALALAPGSQPDGADDMLVLANVGDSRTYLLAAGGSQLLQISQDHSLVATLERQGQLTAAEAAVHPQRNIITRALGVDPVVMVDSWDLKPVTGDRYLMCSDGLTNEVDEDVIAAVLLQFDDPALAADELVRLANEGGGRDNITVAVVDVVEAAASVSDLGGMSADGRSRVLATAGGVADEPVVALNATDGARRDGARRDGARRDGPRRGEAAPTGGASGPGSSGVATVDSARRTRFTWRVGVFLLALLVLVGGTFAVIGFAARNTYFVGTDPAGTTVVVFQGQPGGLLWFSPTVVAETDLRVDDLPAVARRSVTEGHPEPSLTDALTYVENLREQITPTTTTPPTTATSPTTSTTSSTSTTTVTIPIITTPGG
jgi:serine/threonine protein phosphatase PrpC